MQANFFGVDNCCLVAGYNIDILRTIRRVRYVNVALLLNF